MQTTTPAGTATDQSVAVADNHLAGTATDQSVAVADDHRAGTGTDQHITKADIAIAGHDVALAGPNTIGIKHVYAVGGCR